MYGLWTPCYSLSVIVSFVLQEALCDKYYICFYLYSKFLSHLSLLPCLSHVCKSFGLTVVFVCFCTMYSFFLKALYNKEVPCCQLEQKEQ